MSISGITTGQVQAASTPVATPAETSSVFGDIWDTINPLQHIPIVSSLYRAATDTSISPFANIAGSTIYGGPIGGAIAAATEGISAIGHAIIDDKTPSTAVASATTKTKPVTTPAQATATSTMHASTKEWVNNNLNNIETAAGNTTSNITAHKILATTADWLNKGFTRNGTATA